MTHLISPFSIYAAKFDEPESNKDACIKDNNFGYANLVPCGLNKRHDFIANEVKQLKGRTPKIQYWFIFTCLHFNQNPVLVNEYETFLNGEFCFGFF